MALLLDPDALFNRVWLNNGLYFGIEGKEVHTGHVICRRYMCSLTRNSTLDIVERIKETITVESGHIRSLNQYPFLSVLHLLHVSNK